jgi:prepilin signal peptidase PulO-like enzyme (type II secretory pathway)
MSFWWRIAAFAVFAIPITFIDLKQMRIPDLLSLGGVATVLALDVFVGVPVLTIALEGVVGFGVFWLIRLATGRKLGFGDVKYSVLIAISLGLYGWLTAIAVASVTGLAAGILLLLRYKMPRSTRIPFAPCLTFGAVVSIVMQQLFPGGFIT